MLGVFQKNHLIVMEARILMLRLLRDIIPDPLSCRVKLRVANLLARE